MESRDSDLAAYLVVEDSDFDISFGGMRVDPAVTPGMVAELADCMSLKLAGQGAPVGGAKAGVRAAPDDPRLASFLGRFAEACRDLLSSSIILGKDMGAKQWMLDEIYAALGMAQLAVAQRRSASGRCPDRIRDLDGYLSNMTGQGVFWATDQALRGSVSDARVLIQGFGVVGAGVAWHLRNAGARIVGVSDRFKAVVAPDGLDVEALLDARCEDGILQERCFEDRWRTLDRDSLLAQSADVLVLAAGSYLVDGRKANSIAAPLIVEGANLALTADARETLHARGTRVVPDVIANSSSAAMVARQIDSGNSIDPRSLWAEIEDRIRRNTEGCHQASLELGLEPRAAFRRLLPFERRS